jgi:hypothetical protein
VLYDNLWLSSTDNLGKETIRCGDRAKMGSMPVDKVERPIHAKDAMSTRGVLILPLFCRSDSESRPLSSADPGSEFSADGIHAYFQLRFEKLIRFPPDGLFLLSPLQCVWSQQRTTLENSTIDLDVLLGSLLSITRTTSRPRTPSTGSTVTSLKVSQSRSERCLALDRMLILSEPTRRASIEH